jgi:ABC-type antimicrobial peptide transport system permease subunit
MAESYFPGVDPVGRRIVADFRDRVVAEVIGIVGDARVFGRDAEAPDMIYLAARQMPTNFQSIVARTSLSAADLAPVLRAKIRELDPTLALGRVETMRSLIDESVARPRFRMGLIVSFAAVALVLTLVGLYGTVAYAVSQRAREIGIRFALGAQARSVVGLVVRQGAWFVALGCAVGLAAALAASRWLQEMLFQVTPRDMAVFAGVPLVVAAVAMAAMLAPARRASKVDPVSVLRA